MLKKLLVTTSVICLMSASLLPIGSVAPAFKQRDYEVCTEIEMSVDLLEMSVSEDFKI